MTTQPPRYEVQLISGKVIKDLSYEEANKLFYSHAGSVVRPVWLPAIQSPMINRYVTRRKAYELKNYSVYFGIAAYMSMIVTGDIIFGAAASL